MKKILCFDIDGTLISTGGAGGRSFKKAIKSLFENQPQWAKINFAGMIDPSIFKNILNNIGETYSFDIWNIFKKKYLSFLKAEVKNTDSWIIFDGVIDLLEKIKNRGIKPILMTGNIKEGAFLKLNSIKLDHYFDWEKSIFGEDGKEKRDDLAIAFQKKHGAKGFPIVIGDTPADIKVGKLAGGLSIAVATGIHTHEELKKSSPDYLIENMKNFPLNHIYS